MFKKVDHITRYQDKGYIVHGISDKDTKITVNMVDIRAAVVEPLNELPCYYLVCGMIDKYNMWNKRPVVFLNEGHDQSANRVFKNLLEDDVKRLCITVVYANRTNEGFFKSLWRYRQEYDISCSIQPAISRENLEYGDAMIREAQRDKALLEPKDHKPVLSQQLDELSEMGYGDDVKVDYDNYYAWTALRYILAGFILRPPVDYRIPENDISKAFEQGGRRANPRYVNSQSQWAV
jgi:hypothetical protein